MDVSTVAAERARAAAEAAGVEVTWSVQGFLDSPFINFDPADYVMPQDVAQYLLHTGWHILVDNVRERHVSGGSGAHHARDRGTG